MNDLMTWTNLGTLAGATAAVLVVVQYIKPLLLKIDTRIMALVVALIVLIASTAISGAPIEAYGLAVLNAVLVASAAMGAYDLTFKAGDVARKNAP